MFYNVRAGKRSVEVNVTLEISNTTIEAWMDKESLYYKYLQGNITETVRHVVALFNYVHSLS